MRQRTREALKAISNQLHDNNRISEADLEAAILKGQKDKEAIERYKRAEAEHAAKLRYIAKHGMSGSIKGSEGMKSLLNTFNDQMDRDQEVGKQIMNGVNEYIEKQKREDRFDELLGSANQNLEAAWSRYEEAVAAHDTEKVLEAREDVKKYSDEAAFYKAQIEG